MASEKSLALVIRLVDFSESSYIATLFTQDFGKITAMAKGARRTKSSFESALDLLSVSRIVFLRKSNDAMELLTEAKLEKPFRSGCKSLQRLYAALYIAELLNHLTDHGDPHPDLFRITLNTIGQLDENGSIETCLVRYELQLMQSLGHLPGFHQCVECGREVASESRVAFGLLAGGVMCPRCKIGKRQVVSLSAQGVETMQSLAADEKQHLEIQEKQLGEVRAVLSRLICHAIGKRPRLFDFLGYA